MTNDTRGGEKDLKPCPFCEAEPIPYPDIDRIRRRCLCKNEDCPGHNAYAASFEKWNTRPIEDRLTAENARLREAAKNVLDQFDAIKRQQRQLLIRGKTLEQAEENWDSATLGLSIDFSPLLAALEQSSNAAPKTGKEAL